MNTSLSQFCSVSQFDICAQEILNTEGHPAGPGRASSGSCHAKCLQMEQLCVCTPQEPGLRVSCRGGRGRAKEKVH